MNYTVSWQQLAARIVTGHRVASGLNGNARFPGGTLRMQTPHFLALGLNIAEYHAGTLNVSIAPSRYRVLAPRRTFRAVKWHPTEPAEDFSFFDVRLMLQDAPTVAGMIYYPHPDTKPAHFQHPNVLELLLPFVGGLESGNVVQIEIPAEQMVIMPLEVVPIPGDTRAQILPSRNASRDLSFPAAAS
jgi:hypothetical protein